MNVITKRNLKLFFRDKSAVFFSLLAVFIIIGLYAMFLGDVWMSGSIGEIPDAGFLMNSWIIAGLLSVASVTTTMGAFGIMIDDKTRKIDKEFYASPVKRSRITGGYVGSAFLIGIIMSLVTLVIGEIYIVLKGGSLLPVEALAKTVLLIFLSALTNTAMVSFLVSFLKSQNAFSTASTIIGTLIGFLTGIYLPIGVLPASVQTIIKVFPVSHAAVLFRQVFMAAPLQTGFEGVPASYQAEFKAYMGVSFQWGGHEITPLAHVVILLCTAVIFYGLALLNMSRKNK